MTMIDTDNPEQPAVTRFHSPGSIPPGLPKEKTTLESGAELT